MLRMNSRFLARASGSGSLPEALPPGMGPLDLELRADRLDLPAGEIGESLRLALESRAKRLEIVCRRGTGVRGPFPGVLEDVTALEVRLIARLLEGEILRKGG